jgi:IclR family acetate operon transcriptional repressor
MELLARKDTVSLRAVVQALRVPVSSAHRLLAELAEHGVVERRANGEWELSYKLLEITGRQLGRLHWPRLARPLAEVIARETGENVNMSAATGRTGVVIDKVRAGDGPQLDFPIGAVGPLYLGGAGKAMLAFMSEDDKGAVLRAAMPPFTRFTITSPRLLEAELKRIRRRGYAIDGQEVVLGIWCVAVPIFDRSGHPIGALSITGPSEKRAGPELAPRVGMLTEACVKVSRRMGFIGPWPGAPIGSTGKGPNNIATVPAGAAPQSGRSENVHQ